MRVKKWVGLLAANASFTIQRRLFTRKAAITDKRRVSTASVNGGVTIWRNKGVNDVNEVFEIAETFT